MCNRYNIKGTTKDVAEFFRATAPTLFDVPSDDILPGYLAPGLLLNQDGERELVPMQFAALIRQQPNGPRMDDQRTSWPISDRAAK